MVRAVCALSIVALALGDTCSLYEISSDAATCGQSDLDCKYTKFAKAAEKGLIDGTCADNGYSVKTGTSTKTYPIIGDITITKYSKGLIQWSGLPDAVDSQVSLCNPCYQIGGQGINQILNYILNVGVVGGCGTICAAAIPAGGAVAVACDLVCSAVGVKAFIAAISKADLDPIYFCEVVHACPAGPDDGYLELVDTAASPTVVAKGDDIKVMVELNVTNQTGVGEFGITIDGPGSATPLSQSFFLEKGVPTGEHQMLAVTLTLKDGKDEQGFPKTFEGGEYNFTFHVCQGSCGSSHPHSKDFGIRTGTFLLNGSAPTPPPPPQQECEMQMDQGSCEKTADPFDMRGGACLWCDKFRACQGNAFPCSSVQIV